MMAPGINTQQAKHINFLMPSALSLYKAYHCVIQLVVKNIDDIY